MQSESGENMLQSAEKCFLGKIGNAMSTFLGIGEIQTAATASYHQSAVSTRHRCTVEPAQSCHVYATNVIGIIVNNAQLKLRAGTLRICADDDKIACMMYKLLAEKCGASLTTVLHKIKFSHDMCAGDKVQSPR